MNGGDLAEPPSGTAHPRDVGLASLRRSPLFFPPYQVHPLRLSLLGHGAAHRSLHPAPNLTVLMDIPTIQQAWQVVARGTPRKALVHVHDLPVPSDLNQGDVLVKVQAAALNPVYFSNPKRCLFFC